MAFDIVTHSVDEHFPAELSPEEAVIHIARKKARAAQGGQLEDRLILAADTLVLLDDQLIGKPSDRTEAIGILERLSGRSHHVITGVVLLQGKREHSFSDSTEVWFHPLDPGQIAHYVDNYQPYDKSGAYAIHEWIGVIGIRAIQGDFYNVMGLPVSRVLQEISRFRTPGVDADLGG